MSSTEGDEVKRAIYRLLASIVLLAGIQQGSAATWKLIHMTSVYADTKGVPLDNPEGVACDGNDFYVADTGQSRILQYRISGNLLAEVQSWLLPDSQPTVIQVNSLGDLYYLDGQHRRIRILHHQQQATDPVDLRLPNDVVPKSFRIDRKNRLYILDLSVNRVLRVDTKGQAQSQLPLPIDKGFISDLAITRQGTILILDSVMGIIHYSKQGDDRFSPLISNLKEFVSFPVALTTDDRGIIYISDQYGSGLAAFSMGGTFLGRLIGTGRDEGRLYYPAQSCFSDQGQFFIADRNNNRAQLFSVEQY